MQSIRDDVASILASEIEVAKHDDPYLVIVSAFDVICEYINIGMSLERIAIALSKNGYKVNKGHLVRHLGKIRQEKGLQPVRQPRKNTQSESRTETSEKASSSKSDSLISKNTEKVAVTIKPESMAEYRQVQKQIQAIALDDKTKHDDLPEDVKRHKYIEVNGETLDVTEMNIDEYIPDAKNYLNGEPIPEELSATVRKQNMIRGKYERALKNFGTAITEWQRTQKLKSSST